MEKSEKTVNALLNSSISGASYLISLQLFSRVLTFVMNQLVVKIVGSKIYGAAMVDFELLLSTILFLSREGFRCALLRADVEKNSSDETSDMTRKQSNLAYLPIPIGFFVSSILIFAHFSGTRDEDVPCYYVSACLYIIAALIELFSEPFYIINLSQLNYQLRFKIEASAVFLKCLCTFIVSFGLLNLYGEASSDYAILSFGISQLVYSVVLLSGYLNHFLSQPGQGLLPSGNPGSDSLMSYFDVELLRLSLTLSLQSFIKHLLTEGDKLLLALLNSAGAEKGRYSVAAHYGSLVARILFQPIEESGRGLFSKLLKSYKGEGLKTKKDPEPALAASNILGTIIKFHILFGLVFICFVPHYTSTLFDLLLGPSWSQTNAPKILSVYCLYVPVMGINGITEAFVQAVAQPKELESLSYAMTFFTLIFLGVGFGLARILPSVAYAVILANCLNLSFRIIWSLRFIVQYFKAFESQPSSSKPVFKLASTVPSSSILAAFVLSSVLCNYSERLFGFETFLEKIKHICVGGSCFLGVCAIIFSQEQGFLKDLRQLSGRSPKQTKED